MKKQTEHWAYEELRKRLKEKTETWTPSPQDTNEPQIRRITKYADHELGTVFLMDPQTREEIDENLLEIIYPHIMTAIEGERLTIPTIDQVQQTISDRREADASRVITFQMSDPARPVNTNERPLWYFSFILQVQLLRYMLTSECLISIPFPVAGPWLLDLLADSRIYEVQPSLSTRSDEFVLSISSDAGKGFVGDDWKAPLFAWFRGHVRIAEYVDRFEENPFNYVRRGKMIEAIAAIYNSRASS